MTATKAAAPNFRTLDLNLLRVFDAVMAEGSLTRAGAALAMTQPAVSHALRRLRESLGDDLFTRTTHGVRPTPAAEALWPQVRSALALLRQAIAPAAFDAQRDAVLFRLAMADATAALLVPGLVKAIEDQGAAATLRVQPLTTRDPRRLLQANAIDLAMGSFPEVLPALQAEGGETQWRHRPLYDTRYVCVMRRGHPLAGAGALTLDAYCAAPHLLVSFSGRAFGAVDQALAAIGRQRRVVLTVNQFFTAGRVVARSDLLTVLPETFLEATGYRDELAIAPLPITLTTVHVGMLWHLRHDADPAQRWLRGLVQAAAAP
ncbi:MAG: LysR family transcriptional regulator [Burkholderiales bacterium]|nr:LysR family transcriptional regulator [Burkholderiales bacterium]